MHDCLLQIYMESIYQILLPLCLQSPNSLFRLIINYSPFPFLILLPTSQTPSWLLYHWQKSNAIFFYLKFIFLCRSFSLCLPLFSYFLSFALICPLFLSFPLTHYPPPSWPLDHHHKEPLQLPQEWDFSWVSAVIQSDWYFQQLSPTSPSYIKGLP